MRARAGTAPRTAAFIVISMLLLACGGSDDAAPTGAEGEAAADAPRESLTVATASPAAALWAPMWLATPLGFYEDENLEVEVIGQLTGGTAEQALTTGDLDFAGVTQDTLVPLPADVEELPIKLFMMESLWVDLLLVLAESEYETGDDLRGAVIGIPEAKDEAVAELLMSAAGVEPGEYSTLVVGARAPAAVAMERGETDAFAGTFVDQYAMDAAGYETRVIDTGATDSLYNSGIAASNEMLEDNPELVVRFGRAIARAMVWMYENQEASLELLAEVVPEAVEDREAAELLLNASVDRNRPIYEAQAEADGEQWQDVVDLYVELGQLEESYDAEILFTNEFIDDIWDFDVEAEIEAAQSNER